MPNLSPSRPSHLLRAVCLGTLLGLCAANTLTNPTDLLLLTQGAERVAAVCVWIGGWL